MIGGLWKSTSSVALFAAAGLFVGGVAMPSAKAADLGGDCCADLEERVAELEATTARKGNRRVSLTISGQVSTMLMHWNDGGSTTSRASDTYVVDNVMNGTFLQFAGSARINPNVTAGFQLAFSFFSGSRSHQVSQNDDDASGTVNVSTDVVPIIHNANWYIDHKSLGRITVGRANTATAGITTIDLGGAGVIANASIGYTQRSFFTIIEGEGLLRTTTWGAMLGGGTINGSSLSRGNVIAYSSPTVGGFSLGAAWGENDVWDIALRYAGEFSGFRVAAGVGYIHNSNGLNEVGSDAGTPSATCTNDADNAAFHCQPNVWKGSASVMHVASGLYLTGAYVNQDNDAAGQGNTTLWYVQGGIAKNWTGLGNTVLYGEYTRVNHGLLSTTSGSKYLPFTDSRATVWGLGVVQHIDAAAMEVFLAYRRYSGELENFPGSGNIDLTLQDFDVVMGGARIRF